MDKIIILFILFTSMALASADWNPAYYGQKDIPYYFGPFGGDFKSRVSWKEYISFDSSLLLVEDEYSGKKKFKFTSDKQFFLDLMQKDLYPLMSEFGVIKKALVCPHDEMSKNYNYYRYLFRLGAISYLFESLKYHQTTIEKLGIKKSCKINYKKLFAKCNPESLDMRFFLSNAQVVLDNIEKESIEFGFNPKEFKKSWFTSLKKSPYTDISQTRIQSYCQSHKCQSNMDLKEVGEKLNKICKLDSDLLVKVCSEKDRLFGITNTVHAYNMIKDSDALLAVNDNGFAKGCLRRFAIQNKDKEEKSKEIQALFPVVSEHMKKNFDERFEQGQLFPVGSLKLFRDQGLDSLLAKQEVKKEKKVVKVEKKVVKLPPLAPEPLKKFFKKKKKKIVAAKKKVEKKKKVIVKSHFLKAVETREKYSLTSVLVDMDKFKFDYTFSAKMIKILDEALPRYYDLNGLEEMKKFDGLGDTQGVPLRFIKYLIDTNNHDGIYNIIQVLGESFYVQNDIDLKKFVSAPTKILIVNDEYTSYQWQIHVIKD